MEKLIPVFIDGIHSLNVLIRNTDLISSLSSTLEKYSNYDIEFNINSDLKINRFPDVTFETIWNKINDPSIVLTLLKKKNTPADLYKLPKDVLVKLISTISEETGIYYVVRVYYKYGEYSIIEFATKEVLSKYLIIVLTDDKPDKQDIYKSYTLKELIKLLS